jgi:hypothetical protein
MGLEGLLRENDDRRSPSDVASEGSAVGDAHSMSTLAIRAAKPYPPLRLYPPEALT